MSEEYWNPNKKGTRGKQKSSTNKLISLRISEKSFAYFNSLKENRSKEMRDALDEYVEKKQTLHSL